MDSYEDILKYSFLCPDDRSYHEMAEGMSERGLDCSESPQGGDVRLKDGKYRSIDFVPIKEDV